MGSHSNNALRYQVEALPSSLSLILKPLNTFFKAENDYIIPWQSLIETNTEGNYLETTQNNDSSLLQK